MFHKKESSFKAYHKVLPQKSLIYSQYKATQQYTDSHIYKLLCKFINTITSLFVGTSHVV